MSAEMREQLRLKLEKEKEERQKEKEERQKEREKEREIKREEKRIKMQYIKEWHRVRDDLDCDDHKVSMVLDVKGMEKDNNDNACDQCRVLVVVRVLSGSCNNNLRFLSDDSTFAQF